MAAFFRLYLAKESEKKPLPTSATALQLEKLACRTVERSWTALFGEFRDQHRACLQTTFALYSEKILNGEIGCLPKNCQQAHRFRTNSKRVRSRNH